MVSIIDQLKANQMTSVFRKKAQGMLEIKTDLSEWQALTSPRLLNTHIRPSLLPGGLFEKVLFNLYVDMFLVCNFSGPVLDVSYLTLSGKVSTCSCFPLSNGFQCRILTK